MGAVTQAIYNKLAGDATLTAMLSTYKGAPAIFTSDPRPGDSELPCIVTAGEVTQSPADTKTSRGRLIRRDVRCYAPPLGSDQTVEAIAERVRTLLHRQSLTVTGFGWIYSMVDGPITADEQNAQGRIVTVTIRIEEV
jgi:hypothetical protein